VRLEKQKGIVMGWWAKKRRSDSKITSQLRLIYSIYIYILIKTHRKSASLKTQSRRKYGLSVYFNEYNEIQNEELLRRARIGIVTVKPTLCTFH
jgi:hypothetical protein